MLYEWCESCFFDTLILKAYVVIANWLSSYSMIDFLATWEELNNPGFNPMEFQKVRNEKGRF
jgi:SNF family Na+-dependent transporter